jgi:adenylate cyclase
MPTLAGGAIEVREIDAIRVVGKTDPLRVYELLGLTGDISAKTAELRARFECGLGLYRARQWDAASATFNECLKINQDAGPSLLFLDRIEALKGQVLTEPWDGVWSLTEK